jgi:hypothetical protein
MITHFNIITFTLNYVINFEFQNSFNCLALKVVYIHFLNSICLNYAQLIKTKRQTIVILKTLPEKLKWDVMYKYIGLRNK